MSSSRTFVFDQQSRQVDFTLSLVESVTVAADSPRAARLPLQEAVAVLEFPRFPLAASCTGPTEEQR